MNNELYENNDAVGLSELVKTKKVSVRELVDECIQRIEEKNPRLNAINFKAYEYARKRASEKLPAGPLSGIPLVIKDLMTQFEDFPVTNGSKLLDGHVGAQTSLFADRIKGAGLIALGKSSVPEVGGAPTTEPAFYGPTINPWNFHIVPGGSSGGAAVAVASGMTPIADASDGGGSIRIPASVNGVVGLKVSRGRVPYGPDIVDVWYGNAVFGCVSRSIRDTAAFLDIVGGALPGDPYFLPAPNQTYLSVADSPPGRLKIGFVTTQPDGQPLGKEVGDAVAQAVSTCQKLGHSIKEHPFRYEVGPMGVAGRRITAVLNAGFMQSCSELIGRDVTEADVERMTWLRYELGRKVTGVQHAADVAAIRLMGRQIVQQLYDLDVLITPTLPTLPRNRGWYDMSMTDTAEFDARVSADLVFTRPFNVSGQPAISLPLHFTADEVPVGVQFVGRIGEEEILIRLASQLEKAMPWMDRLRRKSFRA